MLKPKKQHKKTISKEDFVGKYSNGTTYSIKEQDMIPKLKDSYIIPDDRQIVYTLYAILC